MSLVHHFKSLLLALTVLHSMHAQVRLPEITIPADHPNIHSSGYVSQKILTRTLDGQPVQSLQFNRLIRLDGKGYGWDNPGTRIAFRTDATTVTAYLYYSENHTSTTARKSVGLYRINGHGENDWTFQTAVTDKVRAPEIVPVALPHLGAAGFHDYELILPYGDAAEFIGLKLNSGAALEAYTPKHALRYVAYGDSVTQGFTSSRVDRTYPFILSERKGWELINAGYGGRSSAPEDAKLISSLNPDIATVLIGVNDWQGGRPIATFRKNMEQFLDNLRKDQPDLPVYLITPLWVPPSWQPARANTPLDEYRQVLRDIAHARNNTNLHLIEGPELIDHDPKYFDRVAVHPNDAGFDMMAARLHAHIRQYTK